MRQIIKDTVFGIIVGVFLGFIGSLVYSWVNFTNQYYPGSKEFFDLFNSPIEAMVTITLIWAVLGILFSFSGYIFIYTKWGFLIQATVHFIIILAIMITGLSLMGVTTSLLSGFMNTLIVVLLMYAVMVYTKYTDMRRDIKFINSKL